MSITTLHSTFLISPEAVPSRSPLRHLNTEVGFTVPQLKPRFYLFQRVRDQLYLTLPSLEEHTSSSAAYLGALGFTKPLEKLVLYAVPMKSLLEWLSKPKGPNLVEATVATAPEKALVLAATRRMLYGEDPLYVGMGLVYKPHYVSTESFCIAYMHLNVWHAAGSSEDSADKLDFSRFIQVSTSEMSDMVLVAMPHPVFLDVGSKEAMEKNWRTPGSPLVSRFQAPYCVEPAAWGRACSSDHFSSSPRGRHRTHAGVRAREVSPESTAGA